MILEAFGNSYNLQQFRTETVCRFRVNWRKCFFTAFLYSLNENKAHKDVTEMVIAVVEWREKKERDGAGVEMILEAVGNSYNSSARRLCVCVFFQKG